MENMKELVKSSGLKQSYIANKIGVTQAYLNMMLSGARIMSDENKRKIKEICMKQLA